MCLALQTKMGFWQHVGLVYMLVALSPDVVGEAETVVLQHDRQA